MGGFEIYSRLSEGREKTDIMLLLFRNNQFTTSIPLALYIGLTHLSALTGVVHSDLLQHSDGGLLYEVMFGWAAKNPGFSALGAVVLVFLQALFINRLADEFRLMNDRNWLPGLFYALAAACLPDFLFLSPPLVAATFIPVAARRIFQSYQKSNGAAYILDASLWTMAGSLFYPPMIFLLVAAVASVLAMRSFSFREQWVFVIGALVPLLLAWLGFFWFDSGTAFLIGQFDHLFGWYSFVPQLNLQTLLKAGILAATLLFVVSNSARFYYRKLIQTQKCVTTLYWFMAVAAFSVLLQSDLVPVHFVLLMPSAGIFLAIAFNSMRNRILAEIAHLLLLSCVLFIQYLPT